MKELLRIDDLKVNFTTYAGEVQAVRGVSLSVNQGESIAIVGESGCGKSVTAQTMMKLIPTPPGKIVAGSIKFLDREIVSMSEKQMQAIRGKEIGMIFQDPMTSLNPTMTVGKQIMEVLSKQQTLGKDQQVKKVVEMLRLVGIPNPETRMRQYPHQFSGGMRQRVMIAMALVCNPKLLIADEPTTALDVTIQAQIMELMQELKDRLGTSIILITHDLGVVAGFAERIIVMYAGRVIESGTTRDIFYNPRHPYTRGLLKSIPRPGQCVKEKLMPIPGRPPDLISPPGGCAFWPRCSQAMKVCQQIEPSTTEVSPGHKVVCWLTQIPNNLALGVS